MVDGRSKDSTESEPPEFTTGMGSYGMLAGEIRSGGFNIIRTGLCRNSTTFALENASLLQKKTVLI